MRGFALALFVSFLAGLANPALPAKDAPQPPMSADMISAPMPLGRVALPKVTSTHVECMAEVIYREARGEPVEGQYAVADVVMNRLKRRWRNAGTVCEVARARYKGVYQFEGMAYESLPKTEPAAWAASKRVAADVLTNTKRKPLDADHFWRSEGCTRVPAWVSIKLMRPVACVGKHWFWVHA